MYNNKVNEDKGLRVFEYLMEKTSKEEAEIIFEKVVPALIDNWDLDRIKKVCDKLIMARKICKVDM